MMTKRKKAKLLDSMIDDYIDTHGIIATIQLLLALGCTESDLRDLRFAEEDIALVQSAFLDEEEEY